MGIISKKRAEWFGVKYLVFSFLFLSILHPQIESAPTRPNKYYHIVGAGSFRFRFPSKKSHFNYAEKMESLVSNENGGIKLALHHNIHPTMINSTSSTKWIKNVVLHSLERDKHGVKVRMAANSTYKHKLRQSAKVPVSGNLYGGNFIVNVGFGTPPKRKIKMIFDTTNDVSWLQCNYTGGSSSYKQLTCNSCNLQVDGMSCSRKVNQCIYQGQYNDGGEAVKVNMSEDTLWLGSRPFHNFSFGCGNDFSGLSGDPSTGLLALSRNAFSLPSQTASLYHRKFSYCVPNFLNPHQTGSLRLGLHSVPPNSNFTALLSNPLATSWYFLEMTGISVAGKRLKVSPEVFRFDSRGEGGTIIGSGVLISRLVKPAYDTLRAAFVNETTLALTKPQPGDPLDTCFNYSGLIKNLKIPGITFHFQGGVRLRIHKQGILIPTSENVVCLAFQAAEADDMSIIGALQQQGYIISFDQDARRIGFASVRTCTS